ncbi:NTTRR-F1 domain [Bacillus carboniphilus]|uniref:NTTRR-F1 domain n=1 Tax=Bacillus carboniphilus TaxID=86663 RepID=A0ABY9JV14_9BACI|nr:NTTRR-F1 domain [Bacillus carboniphilus]WLR43252.1 NTTRR-F1 domain [Bacillus carboniphilus]
MTLLQNIVINGQFQSGELSPWTGINACIVENPCPTVVGRYSALLKGGSEDATLEQLINVVKEESYQLFISLAANQKGTSPFVRIVLEYLDSDLVFIENGVELNIEKSQLPNGKQDTFKLITENTTTLPQNAAFARLIITKKGIKNTTAIFIDNVVLNRVNTSFDVTIPFAYVGNTGETSVTPLPIGDTIQLSGGNPVAMALVNNCVYVANGRIITVIDTTDDSTTPIAISLDTLYQYNRNILVNSSETKIYVCAGESTDSAGLVVVIDTSSNSLEAQVEVGVEPVALALTSDDETLYVLSQTANTVSVIDTDTNTFTASFTASTNRTDATFLQINPDNSKLIIGYQSANSFDVYNIPENTFNQSIAFPDSGLEMRSIGLSLDESYIFIGTTSRFLSYDSTDLSFFAQTADDIPSGDQNTFVQVQNSTNTICIYVGISSTNRVYQILKRVNDSLEIITNVSISNFNSGFIGLSGDNETIVTANEGNNTASLIELDTLTIFGNSNVGSSPQVLVVI